MVIKRILSSGDMENEKPQGETQQCLSNCCTKEGKLEAQISKPVLQRRLGNISYSLFTLEIPFSSLDNQPKITLAVGTLNASSYMPPFLKT